MGYNSTAVSTHGPRNDFGVGGAGANYTKHISIQNIAYSIYTGSRAEPRPTNDLVHFSLKI